MKPTQTTAIIGLQWGDEGKGKLTDVLAKSHDITVRVNGGNNAGHTVKTDQLTAHFSLLPSSSFHQKPSYIAQAVAINPTVLIEEIKKIQNAGFKLKLGIDPRCHLVLPYHQNIDAASEHFKGKLKTGSLKLGIGFTYEDRTNRNGIRLIDITQPHKLKSQLLSIMDKKAARIKKVYGYTLTYSPEQVYQTLLKQAKVLRPYQTPVAETIQEVIGKKSVLFETAQGTYLDFVFGSYPYTVAYHTLASSILSDVGLPPMKFDVLGICKAYTTRVGNGPFPTEQDNKIGQHMRDIGHEYGTVSKRPRRCGWLDLPMVNHAIKLNGVTSIALTKLDVLTGLKQIKVATEYQLDGNVLKHPPISLHQYQKVKVSYQTFPGWQEDISLATSIKQLPKECRNYLNFLQRKLKSPISHVSVGPSRNQLITLG